MNKKANIQMSKLNNKLNSNKLKEMVKIRRSCKETFMLMKHLILNLNLNREVWTMGCKLRGTNYLILI